MGKEQIIRIGNEEIEIWDIRFSENDMVIVSCRCKRLSRAKEFRYSCVTWEMSSFKKDLMNWVKELHSSEARQKSIAEELRKMQITDEDRVFLRL
jgi:hypothetical protein